MPITWRNVDAPSNAGVAQLLALGSAGINTGFDKLGQVIAQREALDNKNWNQQKANNTAALLAQGNQADTPEAFQASRKALQEQLLGMGAQVDAPAVQNFLNNQTKVLQDRTKSAGEYQDYATDRAQVGDVNQVKLLMAQGKTAEARTLLEQLNLRNEAPLYDALKTGERADTAYDRTRLLQGREDVAYDRKVKTDALADELIPGDHKNRLAQQALTTAEITDKTRNVGDASAVRNLQKQVVAAQQNYIAEQGDNNRQLGMIAMKLGYPVDASGMPMLASMTEAQIKELKKHDTPANTAIGDTRTADNFIAELRKSGAYTPELLAKTEAEIRKGFNSIGNGLVGVDAYNRDLESARTNVATAENDTQSWYAPGSADALTANKDLRAQMKDLVPDSYEARDMNTLVHKYATEGFKLKNGKVIVPSNNDIISAINSTTDSIGWNAQGVLGFKPFNTHADNVHKRLEEILNTPEAVKRISDSEESAMVKRRNAVKAILNK